MRIVLIGPGKLGTAVAMRLPKNAEKLIIGRGEVNARKLAEKMDWPYSLALADCAVADVIILALDAHDINGVLREVVKFAQAGTLILNMATKGVVDDEIKKANPQMQILDAKVIGSALGLQRGMPGIIVTKTPDQATFAKVQYVLCGFDQVVEGDPDLVPKINSIGSGEGVRAAVIMRKKLEAFDIPQDWADMILRSVGPGTMQAFAENRLGHFAQELADQVLKEWEAAHGK